MIFLRDILAMRSPLRLAVLATITGLLVSPSISQTYTTCDPTESSDCPPDPALGKSASYDFTSGASNDFTAQGTPSYDSTNGAAFSVAAPGEAPQLNSKWYIMFGKYEVTMKVAPGAGIVSSIVLQSDDLDEIDWELLGAEPEQAQSNYFGKGQTTTYDRGAFSAVSSSTIDNWHTYGVEWTSEQITWQIDGQTVRTLLATDADDQYPQTPCQFKIGVWAGGDPSNAPGTIEWSHGPTNYADGPFTMYVKSLSITDYSTGTEYEYGNTSGDWESIKAVGGEVNGNLGGGSGSGSGSGTTTTPPAVTSTPKVTSTAGGVSIPSSGSGSPATTLVSSTVTSGSHPSSVVAGASTTLASTNYPGLPTGWGVNPTSGKVIPSNPAPTVAIPARFACAGALAAAGGFFLGSWM